MAKKSPPPQTPVIAAKEVATQLKKQTTTSHIFVCVDEVLFVPSKSEHRISNQFDLPSCSNCFNSESERTQYILKAAKLDLLSKREFRRNFFIISIPIKFFQRDEPCEKLFTGLVIIVKNKDLLLESFLMDKNELWIKIDEIIHDKTKPYITPMFKRAVEKLIEEKAEILDNRGKYFW